MIVSLAILIEHFGGAFPAWLAPIQVKVIPVSNLVHDSYTKEIEDKFKQVDIRVERDIRNEKLGYKIRDAQIQKIPYVLVIGDKEMENASVNVRKYGEENSEVVSLHEFIENLQIEIKNRNE